MNTDKELYNYYDTEAKLFNNELKVLIKAMDDLEGHERMQIAGQIHDILIMRNEAIQKRNYYKKVLS